MYSTNSGGYSAMSPQNQTNSSRLQGIKRALGQQSVGHNVFRKRPPSGAWQGGRNMSENVRRVEQIRQTTWLEVRRLFSASLAGHWALAVFLVVGHAACHLTGPSVVLSVFLAAINSALSGKKIKGFFS